MITNANFSSLLLSNPQGKYYVGPLLRTQFSSYVQDSDVFFRRPLTLKDFGIPLPPTIGMASEAVDVFPYNAGIMLMNLPRLRVTYESFLSFILGNKKGLYFSGYGPQDQVSRKILTIEHWKTLKE